jgi:hypothetical protein
MKRRILLTGKTGQVGSELLRLLPRLDEVVAPDRLELDLLNANDIRRAVREIRPEVIINAAAHTAVDANRSMLARSTLTPLRCSPKKRRSLVRCSYIIRQTMCSTDRQAHLTRRRT